jgi:hypothetical protein
MARVLCASKVEYTLKIKKIVRGGTRSCGTLRRTLPPPVGPAGGRDTGAGHAAAGHKPAQAGSYPQAESVIRPRLDTLSCG